ncbi:hypothetical protein RHSIM_Rhsim05G0061500 [Rhododendron simsii]|uniref:Uncharacterized protein n=1 Tax=Rhododendron simsii TaxID=118357 RepID=A0A834GYE3_RHOSS|nr:hypothetical protein RHSIM_Rhsim05G0061500 [Rhododendron simsii]
MEDGRYACSCREDDSIIPDNLPKGYSGFVVNLWFRNEVERASGDDALVLDSYKKWLRFPNFENMEMILDSCIKSEYKKVLPIAVEVVVRTLQGSMGREQEAIARAFTEPADAIAIDNYRKSYNNMEDGRYACSCRQDDSIIPNNLPDGYSGFVVNLWFRHEVERASGDDALVLDSFRKWIKFPTVKNMEMALGSPISCWPRVYLPERIEDLVVEKVVSFAYSIMKDTKNAHKKVLPIAVEVVVRTLQGSMESYESEEISWKKYCSISIPDASAIFVPPFDTFCSSSIMNNTQVLPFELQS